MPRQRLIAAILLIAACLFSDNVFARLVSPATILACDGDQTGASSMPAFDTTQWSIAPPAGNGAPIARPEAAAGNSDRVESTDLASPPRQMLADFALQLRNIRYRRGGREPSTGFDCSGFVHYVFLHTLGLDLPSDAPGQFGTGQKIARTQMQTGDLVFFHTRGGSGISHVGIYLDDGRFIHSPSPGKSVRIDRLDDAYWAKRFVGARRLGSLSLSG